MFPRIVKISRAFANCCTKGVWLQWDEWPAGETSPGLGV